MTVPAITGSIVQIGSTSASGSQSITVPSDATCALLLISYACIPSSIALSSASINSVNFTLTRNNIDVAGLTSTTAWYLLNPATGTRTFAWTWAGDIQAGANIFIVFLKDTVTSGNPVTGSGNANGNGGEITTTSFSSTTNDLCVCVVSSFSADAIAGGGGQTEVADSTAVGSCEGAVGTKAGVSGTTTMVGNGSLNSIIGLSVSGSISTYPVAYVIKNANSVYRM